MDMYMRRNKGLGNDGLSNDFCWYNSHDSVPVEQWIRDTSQARALLRRLALLY